MNTKKYIKSGIPFFIVMVVAVIILSCQDDKEAVPNITSVRYTVADSIAPIDSAEMGATIAILGSGLQDVQMVKFNTIEKMLNPNYVTSSAIIVTVPDEFPTEITNQLCLYTASEKEYCFDFIIEIPGPQINAVSYGITGSETPDIIRLEGYNFAEIKSLTMGTPAQIESGTGTQITGYEVFNAYTIITFDVPVNFQFDQSEIKIVTLAGEDQVSIDWEATLAPSADGISNEYAMVGDTTAIIGKNLASIESITFGSIEVEEFWESEDYLTLKFIVPDGATPGDITVTATNTFGDASISFGYRVADEMILDFDDKLVCWPNPQQSKYDSIVIKGDTNRWGYMRGEIQPSWWDETKMYCMCDEPYVILSTPDALNNLVVKFEVNVRKPWSGGGSFRLTFMQYIESLGDFDELYNYHWTPPYTDEEPYTTDGWLTITIPLSDFELNSNYSASDFDVTMLRDFRLRFYHDGNQTESLTDMDVNVDNIRIVLSN